MLPRHGHLPLKMLMQNMSQTDPTQCDHRPEKAWDPVPIVQLNPSLIQSKTRGTALKEMGQIGNSKSMWVK